MQSRTQFSDLLLTTQKGLKQFLELYRQMQEVQAASVNGKARTTMSYIFGFTTGEQNLENCKRLEKKISAMNSIKDALSLCKELGNEAHNLLNPALPKTIQNYSKFQETLHAARSYLLRKIKETDDGQLALKAEVEKLTSSIQKQEQRKLDTLDECKELEVQIAPHYSTNCNETLYSFKRVLAYLGEYKDFANDNANLAFPVQQYNYACEKDHLHYQNIPRVLRPGFDETYLKTYVEHKFKYESNPIATFETWQLGEANLQKKLAEEEAPKKAINREEKKAEPAKKR